jgi:predicted HicB family RNase H-like nuclease
VTTKRLHIRNTVRMKPELDSKFTSIAENMGISKNALFIMLITDYVKKVQKQ